MHRSVKQVMISWHMQHGWVFDTDSRVRAHTHTHTHTQAGSLSGCVSYVFYLCLHCLCSSPSFFSLCLFTFMFSHLCWLVSSSPRYLKPLCSPPTPNELARCCVICVLVVLFLWYLLIYNHFCLARLLDCQKTPEPSPVTHTPTDTHTASRSICIYRC